MKGKRLNFKSFFTSLLLAGLLGIVCVSVVHGNGTITVMNTNDSGVGSLRLATIDAGPGDTIEFDSSLSGHTITLTSGELTINKDLTITGLGQDNLTISGNNSSRVFNITAGNVEISGLTITNGKAADGSPGNDGENGGAIYSDSGSNLTLTNCIIRNNSSGNGGGDDLTINGGDGGDGGAIYSDGVLTLTNCTLDGNNTGNGGNSDPINNSYAGNGGDGVGIFTVNGSTLSMNNCILTNNNTGAGGTGYNNGIPGDGGGLCGSFYPSSFSIANCVFAGNTAGSGGGIRTGSNAGVCNITNCTFSGNTPTDLSGGGIYISSYNQTSYITNCIFWGDSAPNGPEIFELAGAGGSVVVEYCDIDEDGYEGSNGNIRQDPLFVGDGDYHLQAGSPCIDAGTSDGTPTLDFEGDARWDDPGTPNTGGGSYPYYDIGADEYVADYTYNTCLPGGSGNVTDYRIYTIPVNLGTGSDLKAAMQGQLGAYNKNEWRVFGRSGTSYIEMDSPGFLSLPFIPGNAFWVTSFDETGLSFSGPPAPTGDYYTIPLSPGWNLFGLPWHSNSIDLGSIAVEGSGPFWITSENNTLTQKCVWDYTGSGPDNGYVKRQSAEDTLYVGKGYWIKVLGGSAVTLLIPPDDSGEWFTATSYSGEKSLKANSNSEEEPPPPPGGTSNSSGFKIEAEGGCFIATAAYGSTLHRYVNILRDFRDRYLLTNELGKKLVSLYYKFSPPVAELIADNAPLKIPDKIVSSAPDRFQRIYALCESNILVCWVCSGYWILDTGYS